MELTAVLTPAEEGGYIALNPETGTIPPKAKQSKRPLPTYKRPRRFICRSFLFPLRGIRWLPCSVFRHMSKLPRISGSEITKETRYSLFLENQ